MATEAAIPRTRSGLTPLCKLAQKYGTDKLGFYTPIYDALLAGRNVFKVLEVGIGTPEAMKHVPGYKAGASLRMWREYFLNDFGSTEIYGMDINPNACAEAADERIVTICADSTNVEDVLEVIPKLVESGKFDLIVDDGEHTSKSQIETFCNLSPLLAPGGLYIIEDAECNAACLPEHTEIHHVTKNGTGKAILIRQEALNG